MIDHCLILIIEEIMMNVTFKEQSSKIKLRDEPRSWPRPCLFYASLLAIIEVGLLEKLFYY